MIRITAFIALGGFALALSACDVEQTEPGEAPEVNVEPGQMPEYNVDTADVDVGTETQTVEVPTIDVEEADASAVD